MEYKIVHVVSCHEIPTEELERVVNDEIKQGWIPQGGVAMHGADYVDLIQAMVREESFP